MTSPFDLERQAEKIANDIFNRYADSPFDHANRNRDKAKDYILAFSRRVRDEALERAAKQAEAMRSKTIPAEGEATAYDLAFQHAAGAIRALKSPTPTEEGKE